MRLLHARHADHPGRAPTRHSGPDRGGGADRHLGQSVPLHRLSEHRGGGARCGQTAARPRRALSSSTMAVRFDDIGNRLKAFRLGSGLAADEIASRLGISRTALYRFEKGELAKIETLEKLAELLGVSIPTLLGVGVEYIASAVAYFERMRQIEETSEHIIVLAGPISYLLASHGFDQTLEEVFRENVPARLATPHPALAPGEKRLSGVG